jgi:hypothetical protein
MDRNYIAAPAVAVAGGAVGCALRAWGLRTAFEPETGLPIPGMPATWALILLSIAMAAVLLVLVRGCRNCPLPGGYDQAFSAKGSTAYMTCMVLSAFALLAAAAGMLLDFVQRENTSMLRLILAVLCVVSAVCVLSTGRNNYRGEGRGKYNFTLLMPAYTFCVWLIAAYQVRAGDPVQLDYIYEILAIIAALLGLYFTAGFSFERLKAARSALFSLLGVYFSIVTLADRHDLPSTLLYCFAILMLLTSALTLLRNVSQLGTACDTKESHREESSDEP